MSRSLGVLWLRVQLRLHRRRRHCIHLRRRDSHPAPSRSDRLCSPVGFVSARHLVQLHCSLHARGMERQGWVLVSQHSLFALTHVRNGSCTTNRPCSTSALEPSAFCRALLAGISCPRWLDEPRPRSTRCFRTRSSRGPLGIMSRRFRSTFRRRRKGRGRYRKRLGRVLACWVRSVSVLLLRLSWIGT